MSTSLAWESIGIMLTGMAFRLLVGGATDSSRRWEGRMFFQAPPICLIWYLLCMECKILHSVECRSWYQCSGLHPPPC